MNKSHLALFFIVFLMATIYVFVFEEDPVPQVVEETPVEVVGETKVKKEVIKESVAGKYEIDVEYPQFVGETETLSQVNSKIRESITSLIAEQKKEFTVILAEPYAEGRSDLGLNLTVRYEAEINTKLSVGNALFEYYTYTGGAHGITVLESFVFDLKTGKRLSLFDIFDQKTSYLEVLSKESLVKLKEKDPKLETYTEALVGTAPNAQNFTSFVLSEEGFKIRFSDYQVGPHVAGTPIVVIDYKNLEPFLLPSFK